MSRGQILIKNKKRALKNAVGREQISPEYERLNIDPILPADVSKDFMNQKRRRPATKGPQAPTKNAGPANYDQPWLPQLPIEKDYSHGDIDYDEVPDPPTNKPTLSPQGIDLSGLTPGQYGFIFDGRLYVSDSLDMLESAVEEIMRADLNIDENFIIIIKRLPIKIGVSIGR